MKLKDLEELKAFLEDTNRHQIKEHNKNLRKNAPPITSIDELEEPNRSQLIFLNEIFTRISTKQTPPLHEHLWIFYGALNTAKLHASGTLYTRLNSIASSGKNQGETATLVDNCKFHFSLNKFLNDELYEGGDPSYGLIKDHFLAKMNINHLQEIILINYAAEKNTYQEIIEKLPYINTPPNFIEKCDISSATTIPEHAIKHLPATWSEVQAVLKKLEEDQINDKNKGVIEELDPARRIHYQLIKRTALMLNQLKPTSKQDPEDVAKQQIAITGGLLELIYQQIQSEYETVFATLTHSKPEASFTFVTLKTLLNKEGIAPTSPEGIEFLLKAVEAFIRYAVLGNKAADPVTGIRKGISTQNPFAYIEGLNIKDVLKQLASMIHKLREVIIKKNIANYLEKFSESKPEEKTYFSSLGLNSIFATPKTTTEIRDTPSNNRENSIN